MSDVGKENDKKKGHFAVRIAPSHPLFIIIIRIIIIVICNTSRSVYRREKSYFRGVASPETCRLGPTNIWFDQSTRAFDKLCVVGVS